MKYMLGIVALAGCAKIEKFDALPRYACVGEEVVLAWKIKGDPELTVVPATTVGGDGDRRTIHPTANTRVTLVADRLFDSAGPAVHDITVSPAQEHNVTAPIGNAAVCDQTAGTLRASIDASQFGALTVGTVSPYPSDAHSYTVEHAGKTGTVMPQQPSSALAGVPMNGTWTFTVALLQGEQCFTPSLPVNLVVKVTSQCTGGSP